MNGLRRRPTVHVESTVLYDALGPRGRRRVLWATVVSALLVAAAIVFVLWRMQTGGQLENARWSYVLDPDVFRNMLDAFLDNIKAAVITGAIALVAGLFLALGRLSRHRVVRVPAVAWIEFFRGFPAIMLIIFALLLTVRYYHDVSPLWYVVIGLALYNSAVMAEIYRAGILSLNRGQSEAAYSIGLTRWQAMRLVVLPQAIRRMTPLLLTQFIILFKDTTLGYAVGYVELLRRGELIGAFQQRVHFQATVAVAVMFFVTCFVLSRAVAVLERRQRRRVSAGPRGATLAAVELEQAGAV